MTCTRSMALRRRILVTLLAVLPAAPSFGADRNFQTHPPRVASMQLKPRSGGTARLLEVRFAEAGLPSSIPFVDGPTRRLLRDDGAGVDLARDGVYSSLVDSDPAEPAFSAAATTAADLDPEKTLLVRHTSVVNNSRTADPCRSTDPNDAKKKWTFGYLMTQMAHTSKTGISPSDLAKSLLRQWEDAQTVNGQVVLPRPMIRELVTDKWLRASGNNGTLAMHKAPFRLLAIVNRVDLRENLFFGEGKAGELRFVWGLLDLEARAPDGSCQEHSGFTLIMEYAVDRASAAEAKAWGRKWVDLNDKTLNSDTYRAALQSLTESVVKAGVGTPHGRANGSALIRIRTNEVALSDTWELRELKIATSGANKGRFVPDTVKQTPAGLHNRAALFGDWVNENESAILAGRHNVPARFRETRFLGGQAFNLLDFWTAANIRNNQARHLVSVGTCSGCHSEETGTPFLHVFPRAKAFRSELSGFLTGVEVVDPVDGRRRRFADLERRAKDLLHLTRETAVAQVAFQPLTRTH